MKVLLDQNLPWRLLGNLRRRFARAAHVSAAGLGDAPDSEAWEYAKIHGFASCSKDSDFRQMSFLYGSPPKVIWLDVGNAGTDQLASLLQSELDAIAGLEDSAESLLVISTRTGVSE
jgi:predicted nuclease of predicted toxin-antitoxin system